MNRTQRRSLGLLKIIYKNTFYRLFATKVKRFRGKHGLEENSKHSQALIKAALIKDSPCMIARFGYSELSAVSDYLHGEFNQTAYNYVTAKTSNLETTLLDVQSGFFPCDNKSVEKFCKLILEDIKELDILVSWLQWEYFVRDNLKDAIFIHLQDIEPYYFPENPWSECLKGKRVLVIHPFEDSIKRQYEKREYLFKNNRILPEFDLITLKAVQSLGGTSDRFNTWFEALEYMKERINKVDFDIAIIGCGAYGFPLAAHVKRIGKKAVHMGGATQLLFGIKGKKWAKSETVSKLFNDYWIYPAENERPLNYKQVEDGCYW